MAGAKRLEGVDMTVARPLDPRLIGPLLDAPQTFDFFQAVRLLEDLRPERAPVGEFFDPKDEVVRFKTPTSVAFPVAELQALEDGANDAPANLVVNFMGLTGPQGVLPLDYSLYVANRARAGDRALKDFLGLFDHRILSLFYRAWAKSRAGLARGDREDTSGATDSADADRRGAGRDEPIDWLTTQVASIIGMESPALRQRLPIPQESLLFFAGLLSLPTRPAVALEQLLADYFGVDCEVDQFVGAWYPLDVRNQTALGSLVGEGVGGALGGGAVAGDEVWDQQGRVRVRLGPLAREQYEAFLPGGDWHAPLRALTRFFSNDQFDVEVQLVLSRDDAPACRLDADDAPLPLGWCTWLRTQALDRDPDDAVFTL